MASFLDRQVTIRTFFRQSVLALATLLVTLGVTPSARAAEPLAVDLAVRVDGQGRVAGVERIAVRVDEGESSIALWLWADRLAEPPRGMDEQTWRYVYPGEVDRGGARLERVELDGAAVAAARTEGGARDVAGTVYRVEIPAGPARELSLIVRFRVELPQRFGRLGRVDDVLSLAGPWMPLVLGPDAAWDARTRWRVSVETTWTRDVAIGEAVGTSWRGRPLAALVEHAAYVPVLIARHLHVEEVRAPDAPCGARVIEAMPPVDGFVDLRDAHRFVLDDRALGRVATVVGDACRTLGAAELGALVPATPLPVFVVPSRVEVASSADGVVLVSDHAYQVSHIDALLDFHDRAVRRAVMRVLARPLSLERDAAHDRPWADDARAVLLGDADDARRRGRAQTPDELVGFAAFHPTIDQLLYAPQVPFADAYFGQVEEDDVFRDDPMRALEPLPRGRRLLDDARLALGDEGFARAAHGLLHGPDGVRALFPRAVDAWLRAPGRPSAIRLGAVSSTRDANGFAHSVEIVRLGAETAEPVDVEVEDAAGHVVHGTWDGAGARGVVVVHTPAALGGVRVDPRGLVPQSGALDDGHPRTNDATGQPWRPPLLNGFELSYSAAEQRVDGLIDFAFHQRYDLDHMLGLRLVTNAATTGGILRYIQGVGPLRDRNGRIGVLSAGLDVERLRTDFSPSSLPGWAGAVVVSGGVDTRVFRLDWRYGWSLTGALRIGAVRRDDGMTPDAGRFSGTVAGSVRGSLSLPLGLRQMVMFVAGAGLTVQLTDLPPVPAERQSLGGLALLRGFAANELLGLGRVFGVAEYRGTVLADLSWSIFDLVYVREIQVAAFAGAGVLFSPIDLVGNATGEDARFVASAGFGLRFHYLYGGVQPGVMSVDLAAPIVGTEGGLGDLAEGRVRVAPYLSFDQYF